MNKFFYKAKNQYNEIIQGSITAQNFTEAAMKLEHKGYIVIEIKENVQPTISSAYHKFKINNTLLKPFSLSEKKDFIN